MLASETEQNGLAREVNNSVVGPPNKSYTFKSTQHTKVNSKSLLWAGKHILYPFYPYSIFYPHDGGLASLQHSEKKQ